MNPDRVCPSCGNPVPCAKLAPRGQAGPPDPQAGDFIICQYCAAVARIDEGGSLRKPGLDDVRGEAEITYAAATIIAASLLDFFEAFPEKRPKP